MLMERYVKILHPQNTFGVSRVNRIAAKFDAIVVNGGLDIEIRLNCVLHQVSTLKWHLH